MADMFLPGADKVRNRIVVEPSRAEPDLCELSFGRMTVEADRACLDLTCTFSWEIRLQDDRLQKPASE